jgi:hypothetical protein
MVEENFTVYKPEIFLLAISTISIPTDPHHPVFSRITQPIIRHPQRRSLVAMNNLSTLIAIQTIQALVAWLFNNGCNTRN